MRLILFFSLFTITFFLPFIILIIKNRYWGLPVTVRIDDADPQATDIASYFAKIAERLDAIPQRMRVTIFAQNEHGYPISMDSDLNGCWVIRVGNQCPYPLNLRRRWIADHPLPYILTEKKKQILYIEPVDKNRFRVMEQIPFKIPIPLYAIFSLIAAMGFVWVVPEAFAIAIGGSLGCILSTLWKSKRLRLLRFD